MVLGPNQGADTMTHHNPMSTARARHIARTLGAYYAARYLARRGYSIEAARWVLLGV